MQHYSKFVVVGSFLDLSAPSTGSTHASSACFYQPHKVMTLTCPHGHMVKLDDIYYGYTNESRCGYEPGDCVMPMPTDEMYTCVGRSSCDVNLPSGDRGRFMPSCGHYGTYLQADYTCVPGKQHFRFKRMCIYALQNTMSIDRHIN